MWISRCKHTRNSVHACAHVNTAFNLRWFLSKIKNMNNPSKSYTSASKEVKGVVDDEDPRVVVDNRSSKTNKGETNKKEGSNEFIDTGIEEQNQKPKGLPHQQVPQPGDFSAEALDKMLSPTEA
ncbi:hypothetical protein VNO77_20260 [Canavalia gladiata]|uniref:Uncharacterized protein n=1 Tax=Canavalia gladiata TaxID=3824 RepID=A0AAN9LSV4_CANGL